MESTLKDFKNYVQLKIIRVQEEKVIIFCLLGPFRLEEKRKKI